MGIETLLNDLGELGHLRYLNLSHSSIKNLPSSLTRLQNLQTLILLGCSSLVRLPRNLEKLVNLRHLMIDGCGGLTYMPHGLGKLTSLHTLDNFVVAVDGNNVSAHIGRLHELSSLNNLQGDLTIKNLGHASESKSANLREKHLRSLKLIFRDGEEEVDGNIMSKDEKILDILEPHSDLKVLKVYGFMGVRFGGWLSSLTNLVELKLVRCKKCQHLPRLDELPSLKRLVIDYAEEVEYMCLGKDTDAKFFPSLVQLEIRNCPNLKGWWKKGDEINDKDHVIRSFHLLSDLEVVHCPNLTLMPLFPLIEKVTLEGSSSKPLQETIMMMRRNKNIIPSSAEAEEGRDKLLSLLTDISIANSPDLVSLIEEIGNLS
ncbi:LRR domain containing protein, partial [Parasponia andersonii]